MLFDRTFDRLQDAQTWVDFWSYFAQSYKALDADISTGPVLGAPYTFFLLIADVTRFSGPPGPLLGEQLQLAR